MVPGLLLEDYIEEVLHGMGREQGESPSSRDSWHSRHDRTRTIQGSHIRRGWVGCPRRGDVKEIVTGLIAKVLKHHFKELNY